MKMKKIIAGIIMLSVTISGGAYYAGIASSDNFMYASASVNDSSGEVIDGICYRRDGTYSLFGYLPEDYDKEFITVHSCEDKSLKEISLLPELEAKNGGGTRMMVLGRIYQFAFQECTALEKIIIPDTVTLIDKGAFMSCPALTDVSLPASLDVLGEGAFTECTALEKITLPDNVTKIERLAFYKDSKLAEVNIPDTVETIAEYAFGICNLSGEIKLPENLKTLETYAFGGNNGITSYTISENNINFSTKDGILYDKEKSNLILYPAGNERKEWTAPDTVEVIEKGAFLFTQNLEKITLGENVAKIDSAAFQGVTAKDIYILNKDCSVADSKNTIPSNITIHAPEDSYAQKYAEENGNQFVALKEEDITTPSENVNIGDANEDGNVNMADVTAIVQHIGNQDAYGLSAKGIANAELCDNKEGITGMDAVAVQLLLAKQIDKLPYVE